MRVEVAIRSASADDYGFIVHAARREVLDQKMIAGTFASKAARVLTATFDAMVRGGVARVACWRDEPANLIGFALYDRSAKNLLFLYVSHAFRKRGIARRLLEENPS